MLLKLWVLDKEKLCNKLVALHFFSVLDGCDMRIDENGRFSTQLGLAKPSWKGKSKMLFFSERQNYFEEKNTVCLYSC